MDERCSAKIPFDTWHDAQCSKPAVVERNGKWYCKIHDPEYIKTKEAKREAEYKSKCCVTCGWRLESHWRYCPGCGTKKGG
jgi:hypothetical protein